MRGRRGLPETLFLLAALFLVALPASGQATRYKLLGWNNLGMHCMDADYQVMSILPPYNTIHAQLVAVPGGLVAGGTGFTVTYEAVADAGGSINSTSAGKTNFWDQVANLFGASPPVDTGLTGVKMPGLANQAQPMSWDAAHQWWAAEGIPITPWDDAGERNPYPLFRLVARNASGTVVAETQIVLPVSEEMNCSSCHRSQGGSEAARPAAGWVNHPDPELDYRLNVLRLHDGRQAGTQLYTDALAAAGYAADGLYPTALRDGHAILCAKCHASEALPGSGHAGVPPLTRAVHSLHAGAVDPGNGLPLGSSQNRSACYQCHPGSTTRCLRGAMGASVGTDGQLAMQCQSCHGTMSVVGGANRTGWLNEPGCQSCHTGTAVSNNGQIRYLSVFEANGVERQAVNATFATNANTPAAGLSLYRFSRGHGGLACEACHGPTHAESPSSHANDEVQSLLFQGHRGMIVDCGTCHTSLPASTTGGPHGMHPIGSGWVSAHGDAISSTTACRACHGTDYRGTVLSRSQGDWTASTPWGQKVFWRGAKIGCYACHRGPNSENGNSNRAPVVTNAALVTESAPVTLTLAATDADGDPLELRIVSQPAHGTVGLLGRVATFYPEAGYDGPDAFTFAAWDGSIESNLGTVTVEVHAANGLFSDGFETGTKGRWNG